MSDPARVLFVCTGNVCRSALADGMLRRAVDQAGAGDRVRVHSAGTGARAGMAMPEQIVRLAREQGVSEPESHAAVVLDLADIREADLVLAATRAHRSQIVERLPRASRRTFTVREFARLLPVVAERAPLAERPGDPAERLRWLAAQAAKYRGYVHIEDDALDDIVDPMGRSDAVYAQMADQLIPAVESIAAALLD